MKILATVLLLLLNGCLQNTVFLGPAVTAASTGNIYHAGLSYSSNIAITRITGKTPMDNIKKYQRARPNLRASGLRRRLDKQSWD